MCVCVFVCDKVLEVDKKKLGRGQGSGGDDMHVSSSSKDMHVSSSSYIHTGRGQGIGGGRHADRRRSGCSLDSQVREYIAIDEDMLCYFCTHICTPYTHTYKHTHTHTHTHNTHSGEPGTSVKLLIHPAPRPMTSGVWGMSGAGSLAVAQQPTTITLVRRKPFEFSFESIGKLKGLGFRV